MTNYNLQPIYPPLLREQKKLSIIGAGGFSKELAYQILQDLPLTEITFYVDEKYTSKEDTTVLPISLLPPNVPVIIGIADPNIRAYFVNKLPKTTKYFTFIHSSVRRIGNSTIGKGSAICAGVTLTTDVIIGEHCHVNIDCLLGHSAELGSFTTLNPKVFIAGDVQVGTKVLIGANASVRQKLNIAFNTTIGMGSAVVKDIDEPHTTWVGIPAKKLK